jgi:hypothetical protein
MLSETTKKETVDRYFRLLFVVVDCSRLFLMLVVVGDHMDTRLNIKYVRTKYRCNI